MGEAGSLGHGGVQLDSLGRVKVGKGHPGFWVQSGGSPRAQAVVP